jgi:hypothetical protein
VNHFFKFLSAFFVRFSEDGLPAQGSGELLTQICLHAGFPVVLNDLSMAKEVFRDLGEIQ